MAMETKTTLNGESGLTYFFSISPWECLFQPLGAVYTVLGKDNEIGAFTVLYIGQTRDLSTLFSSHRKKACLAHYRGSHIGVHIEPDLITRSIIEADLIVNYKPVCNGPR